MLGPYRRVELADIASESSEAERRAEAAERELMEWKTAQFMESHLGEEYDALIISVQKFGFFVELTEIFVEGLGEHRPARGINRPAMRVSRARSHDRDGAASRHARRLVREDGFSGWAIACECAPSESILSGIAWNFR